MASQHETTGEQVSALADGHLANDELAAVMAQIEKASALKDAWYRYHLIGDALRSVDLVATVQTDKAFAAGVMDRLRLETAAMRPVESAAKPVSAKSPTRKHRRSANSASWKLVAGFTSIAMIAVLAWYMVQPLSQPGAGPQLAGNFNQEAGRPAVNADGPHGMIRDPKLDQLLAAHRQFGGASALQKPAGFLRNATYAPDAQ